MKDDSVLEKLLGLNFKLCIESIKNTKTQFDDDFFRFFSS